MLKILPKVHGGAGVRASMRGGLHDDDEEEKKISTASKNSRMFSIQEVGDTTAADRAPLLLEGGGVSISHIAGTIENSEQERLKKLLFRATRGKALTFFQPFEL